MMNSYGYLKASSIAICNQKVHETVPITSLATLDYDSLRRPIRGSDSSLVETTKCALQL